MDVNAYALAADAETEHWWFRGRRAVLKSVLDKYCPGNGTARDILEVGCGNGGNLPLLSAYGRLSAVEGNDDARARASSRGLGRTEKGWLPDGLPFEADRFDLIAALDVIEHIEDDQKSLNVLRGRLKQGGSLLLTVPAYRWLWSEHDVLSHHKRRYTRTDLVSLLDKAGFEILYSTYFNTLLFPLAVAYFKLGLAGQSSAEGMKPPSPIVNRALRAIFSFEKTLIPSGSLPFGVSILVYARPKA